MSRPAFALTDDQARLLATRVATLQASYPFDQRNHRPFVRAFMRAVHEATGQWYSPAIYQRLLSAFAPERRPSTATLAAEKQLLAVEIVVRTDQDVVGGQASGAELRDLSQLHLLVTDAIDAGLARAARSTGLGGTAETDFYARRLREAEKQLAVMRGECGRLEVELATARQSSQQHAQEAQRSAADLARQADAIVSLTSELADIRKFALQAIEEARGEARVWKERSVALEAQRQLDARLMETFRQLAYQRGAAIPDPLRQDKP